MKDSKKEKAKSKTSIKIICRCFSSILFYYLLLGAISIVFILTGFFCTDSNGVAHELLIAFGCSILSAVFVGGALEFASYRKNKNRKNILLKRITEKALLAFYFIGRSYKDTYFDDKKSINNLMEDIKCDSFYIDDYALYFLRYLNKDLDRCYEGLFKKEEWKGINASWMFSSKIIERGNQLIKFQDVRYLYESLGKIEPIKKDLGKSVYSFEFIQQMKDVEITKRNASTPSNMISKTKVMPKKKSSKVRRGKKGTSKIYEGFIRGAKSDINEEEIRKGVLDRLFKTK